MEVVEGGITGREIDRIEVLETVVGRPPYEVETLYTIATGTAQLRRLEHIISAACTDMCLSAVDLFSVLTALQKQYLEAITDRTPRIDQWMIKNGDQ